MRMSLSPERNTAYFFAAGSQTTRQVSYDGRHVIQCTSYVSQRKEEHSLEMDQERLVR